MDLFSSSMFLIVNIIVLYFISRKSTDELFFVLKIIFKNNHIVFTIISLFFFPGTVMHELAHFFAATILFLKVKEINLMPSWEHNHIRFGHVLYIKKDIFRGILVGVAPIIGGVLFFWWLASLQLYPSSNWFITAALTYLILVVSSMMFSSKQDLVDAVYVVPILVLVVVGLYFFKVDFRFILKLLKADTLEAINYQLNGINVMFIISNALQIVTYFLLFVIRKRLRRHW